MNLSIRPMKMESALEASKWSYGGIYSIYDMDGSCETMDEFMNGEYYETYDDKGLFMGFFCFGKSATVSGIAGQGAYYEEGFLDIGLGMRPEYAGRGLGLEFLMSGINFAVNSFGVKNFRLTVASFNERAKKVYERAGFKVKGSFLNRTSMGKRDFIVMLKTLA